MTNGRSCLTLMGVTYRACLIDHVFFCRWIELDAAEHTFLLYEIERLAKAAGGRLVASIVVVPDHMGLPDEKFRRASIHSTRAVFDFVDHVFVVVEGHGLRGTVMRAAATTMATVAGVGGKALAEESVEGALTRVKHRLHMSVEEVLKQAALQGITSGADRPWGP